MQQEHPLDQIVCFCFGVTLGAIREAVRTNHFKGIEQITRYCSAGGGCRGCQADIRRIIDQTREEFDLDRLEREKWTGKKNQNSMPVIKKLRLVEQCLEHEVKAILDDSVEAARLIHIDGDNLEIKLISRQQDDDFYGHWLKKIQVILREHVDKNIVAVKVNK